MKAATNTMKQLTVKQINGALREVILNNETFQYVGRLQGPQALDTCYYHQGPDSEPEKCDGCVFGQAFQLLGITKDELHDEDFNNVVDSIAYADFEFLPDWEDRPKYWPTMQVRSDAGAPWGELLQFLPTPQG